MIRFSIDGVELEAKDGANLLWTALENGFYIPHLCAVRGLVPPLATCRLCFVEIEGLTNPVAACTRSIKDGMIVHLNTDKVKRIRKTAFEFLLSNHHLDCQHCAKNKNCELQNIAMKTGLKLKISRVPSIPRNLPADISHPQFYYDPNKCVLCGKCVWICQKKGTGILDFANRGINTVVTTFTGMSLAETDCNSCLACVAICPVGALVAKPGISLEQASKEISTYI